MRTIYEVKEFIKSNYGKRVLIKVMGIRNKIEQVEGVISECYGRVFIVRSKFGNKSFTYTDVLVGIIKVSIK